MTRENLYYKNKTLQNIVGEVWLKSPSAPDYMVSNLGRVKSLRRQYNHPIRGNVIVEEKILSQSHNGVGYYKVAISINRIKTKAYVHRLVGEAFIPNYKNNPQINHKNGVRNDNRVENLEWCTNSENNKHAFEVLNRKRPQSRLGKVGKLHHASKKVLCPTLQIEFESARIAGRELGLSQGSISHVCNGRRHHVDGLIFKYL